MSFNKSIATMLLLIGTATFAHGAIAQTAYTWTGLVSSDWSTAANWTPNGVPSSQSDTATFGPASRTSITLSSDGPLSVGALTFASNAPPYRINVAGTGTTLVEFYSGLDNQSTSTRPTLSTGEVGSVDLGNGTFSDFDFVNNGISEMITAGSATSLQNATLVNNRIFSFDLTTVASTAETSSVTNNAGAYIDISGSTVPVAIGSLSGAGDIHLGGQTLAVGNLNLNDSIGGVLSDGGFAGGSTGGLTKVGAGTLTLTGANTFTGKTTVSSGTLQVSGSVNDSDNFLVDTFAKVSGSGSINILSAEAGAFIIPGNANPQSTLTVGNLLCANTPLVVERIGNAGFVSNGTYLTVNAPLTTAFCSHLHFRLTSAGQPLVLGQNFLLVFINGTTDFTAANVDFDFIDFPGYHDATGTIFVSTSRAGTSQIVFAIDSLGDEIFRNGFELFN